MPRQTNAWIAEENAGPNIKLASLALRQAIALRVMKTAWILYVAQFAVDDSIESQDNRQGFVILRINSK